MEPVVETEAGAVRGRREAGGASRRAVSVFRGIPYAAAPVGPLRFRPPEPHPPFGAVLDCGTFGPSPLQSASNPFSGVVPGNEVGAVSEDCLTLNIWTPSIEGRRPVLVWVSGGAFLVGGTSIETYDGATLAADHEVVVVSVNYRLGTPGFLWLGDHGGERLGAAGNCGLRDQLAALRWTVANIERFGGDPEGVTAFGESAGAGSLLHLMAAPAAAKVVRRAILQSPGVDLTLRPDEAARVTDGVLRHLDLGPKDVGRLWELPAEALLAAQERAVLDGLATVSAMPLHPVIDGDVVPDTPSQAFGAGAGSDAALLMSWTADELRLFPNPAADAASRDDLIGWTRVYLERRLGEDPGRDRAERLMAFYEERSPLGGAQLWATLQTDGMMRLPAKRIADLHTAHGGTTRVAEFAWRGRVMGEDGWDRGAFHAIDLPFTFGTLSRSGWDAFLGAGPGAKRLARQHMVAWASFAGGTPEIPGLGPWPAYDAQTRTTVTFDEPCSVHQDPLAEVEEAWKGLWSEACGARASALR